MEKPDVLAALRDAHDFILAERDAFYDCSTTETGIFFDNEDRDEVAEMDELLDRLKAATAAVEGGYAEDGLAGRVAEAFLADDGVVSAASSATA